MGRIVRTNGDLVIRKPENLVKARYRLSPLAIKFLSTIIANIKRSDDLDEEYILKVKDFKELTGQKTKRIYELVEEALEDLLKNPLKIPLDTEQTKFLMTNWVSSAIYDDGQISFLIDKRLRPFLLEIKEKFLKYKLENILTLRSSYSIRLYEILKDWFEMYSRYNNRAEKIISLDEFRDILEIPKSYQYSSHIKKLILLKSQDEFKQNTDIVFDFKEIKTGRKVTHLKFIIYSNKKQVSVESFDSVKNEEKIENPFLILKTKIRNNQINFQTFVKELQKLKNVEITNVLPGYLGKKLKINEFGFLELDGEELDNVKANSIRRILYKHSDLLGEFKEIDEGFMALREKFIGKVLVFKFDNLYYAIGVKDLTKIEDKIKVTGKEILRNIENFEVKFDLEWLKKQSPREKLNSIDVDDYIRHNNTIELQRLEEFFENNKDKFSEWLQELEKESFELSERIIKLDEESEEYKENAKKLELLDKLYMKGYELLEGERISDLDKKMILSAFKKWIINNIE